MKGLAFGLCAAVLMTSAARADNWQFTTHGVADNSACELQIQGEIAESNGADVQLNCPGADTYLGSLQLTLPAKAFRQRRVSLVAEVRSDDTLQTTVSLKSIRNRQTLMLEDDTEQMLLGDSADGWQERSLVLPVDASAAQLRVSVLVQGHGALSLRNVHLSVSEQSAMSNAAADYLDDVLALLKQQTTDRSDLHWRVLEPQLRVLASGAQTTEEVYPAIRYALASIGDRRNMLLTPQVVRGLQIGAKDAKQDSGQNNSVAAHTDATRRLSLSDGAQLVLAPLPPVRTAQNGISAISKALQ